MVCHEANRAYCQTIGDDSQPSFGDAPDWQIRSAVNGVVFHLNALSDGNEPDPSASHNSWLAEKQANGWRYGPIKDPEKKEHPCFLPYEKLPLEQKLKDYIFSAIVKAYWDAANAALD
jgi:hypothetical protein